MEKENRSAKSNRRIFIGKLAKLAAAAGIGGTVLAQLKEKGGIQPAQAVNPLFVDSPNVGAGTTTLNSPFAGGTFVATNTLGPVGQGLVGVTENLGPPPPIPVGVYGLANAGDGVRGDSNSGTGVYGYATAGSGTTYGVRGDSDSYQGGGVYGYSNGIGVQGVAEIASAIPIVAQAASGQAASIQEWQNTSGTPLAVVDASGNLGVGTTAPARSVHLRGNTACFRMDRNANSSAFILVRTSNTDFNTIWKTFYVGVDASAADNGSFFIGDRHTGVSGVSDKRLIIDNTGNVGIGTASPTDLLDVNSNAIRVRTARTPLSMSDAGAQGEICWDSNYVYVCVATNTWRRAALASWGP
jgi:hypothetical protein